MSARRQFGNACLVAITVGLALMAGQVGADEVSAPNALKARVAERLPLLPDNTIAGLIVYPRTFFAAKHVSDLPIELASVRHRERFGVDFRHVEFAIAFITRTDDGPVLFGSLLGFEHPFDWRQMPPAVLQRTTFGLLNDQPYRQGICEFDHGFIQLDAKTILVGPDRLLREMLATQSRELRSSVSQRLSDGLQRRLDFQLVADVEACRDRLRAVLACRTDDADMGDLRTAMMALLAETKQIDVRGWIVDAMALGAVIEARESSDVATLSAALESVRLTLTTAAAKSATPVKPWPSADASNQPIGEEAVQRYLVRMFSHALNECRADNHKNLIKLSLRGQKTSRYGICASVTMLVTPMIELGARAIAYWQTIESMQEISQAIQQSMEQEQRFPARTIESESGQPLLSWRVHLLPFLGQTSLYQEFHLDQPWDSDHNRQLIRRMPAFFQNPARACDHTTSVMVPLGRTPLFGSDLDASRETPEKLMVVMADTDHSVVWTKPDDLQIDLQNAWRSLGGRGFVGIAADGTVDYYPRSVDINRLLGNP